MRIFRHRDGATQNSLLFLYIGVGITASIYLLTLDLTVFKEIFLAKVGAKFFGTIYLAHILVLMAYLTHECMHNTIFKRPKWNDVLGNILSWFLGSAHQPYQNLKSKHLRHHTERRDVLSLDYRDWLTRQPKLKKLVGALQWLHFPAAELLTHMLSIAAPFFLDSKKHLKKRTLAVLASRIGFFLVLLLVDGWLLIGWVLAYILCVLALGFMDTYQHTFDIVLSLDEKRKSSVYDRAYEESHTYSNLLSAKYSFFNLLVLNFCYHNVHHWKSGEPWHRLPRLHEQRYAKNCPQAIGIDKQVDSYHRFRTHRIHTGSNGSEEQVSRIGASGVSFLVGV